MPLTKQQNRHIYITAIVLSFLLIAGSIYLHIRQKHHLGRLSFDRDRDIIKPTKGVEYNTEKEELQYQNSAATEYEIDYSYSSEHFGKMDEDVVKTRTISKECIHCLCMTVNACQITYCSPGQPCGLYRISKLYWIDGGQHDADDDYYNEEGSANDRENRLYHNCVNDILCSIVTIQHYLTRYERDCNKDGIIDCKDYIALHLLGPSGCMAQNVSLAHASRMNKCLGI